MAVLDIRRFLEVVEYLNAWCATQPERSTGECVDDLARFTGCSLTLMYQILDGQRRLSSAQAQLLCEGLALDPEQANHLRACVKLRGASPAQAAELRQQLWDAYAKAHGYPRDAAADEIHLETRSDLPSAALGVVLAALGPDAPRPRLLVKRSIMPITAEQVALADPTQAVSLGPHVAAIPAPHTPEGALAWHAWLGWARDALLRAPEGTREYSSFLAAVDAEALLALHASGRRMQEDLARAAQEAALRAPSVVIGVLSQIVPLTRPILAPDAGQVIRWRRPAVLLPAPEAVVTASPDEDAPSEATNATNATKHQEPVPSPLGYLDFPSCLAAWRAWRLRQGLPASDRWMARRTGLKKGTLQDLAAGRTRLGSHHVPCFFDLFGIQQDREAQAALEAMTQFGPGEAPRAQGELAITLRGMAATRGIHTAALEGYFARSRWYVKAVHVLAQITGFQLSAGWISQALQGRITWKGVEEALRALSVLGMLREAPDGTVTQVTPVVREDGPLGALAQYEYNVGLLQLLRAELGHLDPDIWMAGQALVLPEAALPYVAERLAQHQAEVRAILDAAEARRQAGQRLDRVVLVAWQRFPILSLTARRPS